MTDYAWVDRLAEIVPSGRWTTYGAIGQVVHEHPRTIGSILRREGRNRSAHRVLMKGGIVSPLWEGDDLHGLGGGPAECIARLRDEGAWDERRNCAREERCIGVNELRRRWR
jgi:6-O-methylguanine DNA methyltransferase, DNA binding domain